METQRNWRSATVELSVTFFYFAVFTLVDVAYIGARYFHPRYSFFFFLSVTSHFIVFRRTIFWAFDLSTSVLRWAKLHSEWISKGTLGWIRTTRTRMMPLGFSISGHAWDANISTFLLFQ